MSRRFAPRVYLLPAGVLLLAAVAQPGLLAAASEGADADSKPAEVDFARDVEPIFAARCYACHGPDERQSGLRLDVRADALAGGDRGPALVPGKSGESLLVEAIEQTHEELAMPPEGEPLSAAEIARVRAWIDAGLEWPDSAAGSSAANGHWAFRPPQRPPVPEVVNRAWLRNPIDAFVLARLEAEGITPSPEAPRQVLVRRLYLDLLGLPPEPDEVSEFVLDNRPDAYERLVERLLASPHYGERWARHWLDLARYADSDGYEKDLPRPYAWRYRDWVIEAFNRDLPFDEFTIQQLAGDLLPDATQQSRQATGFHRNTLTNREGGVDQEEFRVRAVIDRVNTTANVWLGLTMACAECHSHKYDPLTQREYYGMFAFFNAAQEVDLPAPLPGETEAYQRAKARYEAEHQPLVDALAAFDRQELPARQEAWEAALREAATVAQPALPDEVATALGVAPPQRSPEQREAVAGHYRALDEARAPLAAAVAEHEKRAPKPPQSTLAVLGAHPQPPPTHVHLRGDFLRPGPVVEPHTPAVLGPLVARGEVPDRLDLARWLVEPAHPLTARVMVNRLWHWHFGRGLVSTLDDFGTRGQPPSHPQLLDWLATELIARGWSHKQMHRLLVCSATYRQSSAQRPELAAVDPENMLLARQHRLRLEAEAVRDIALAASGLLNRAIGGPSVRPPIPAGVVDLGYANSVKWQESEGADRYRRGLYIFFQRTVPYPMLMTFDSPDSNVSCARRERSNTPLQALVLWNDPVFFECAQALGAALAATDGGPAERLVAGCQRSLARRPSAGELARLEALWRDAAAHYADAPQMAGAVAGRFAAPGPLHERAAWVVVARTLMNLDEFFTRE